jgi:equilibrative nucleoside transporter 1/2/3
MADSIDSITSTGPAQSKRKHVSLWTLYKKLHWSAAAVFSCFAITMFFPVFTSKIVSVVKPENASRILQPSTFIPLGFLLWNLGDLTGRLSTALPFMPRVRPFVLFLFSLLRGGHIPLYFLCNLGGRGAVIESDVFYLFVVSFGFGLTNGWLSSSCMMSAGNYVDESEREAAGGFMVLNLVAGLAAGSFLSFSAANVA